MIYELLGQLVNTLTTDEKYYFNRDNLMQQIQTQLCKKQKSFRQFFSAFLKSRSNFQHFEKKDDPESLCIFWNLQTVKSFFNKYVKGLVSRDPLRSNVVNGPKHA